MNTTKICVEKLYSSTYIMETSIFACMVWVGRKVVSARVIEKVQKCEENKICAKVKKRKTT